MIDWKEDFRYEFGDNQPDLEEFIGKVVEEVERGLRLSEDEVRNCISETIACGGSISKAICQLQEGRGE